MTFFMFGMIPHAFTLTRTSLGRGFGTAISSMEKVVPTWCRRAAFIVAMRSSSLEDLRRWLERNAMPRARTRMVGALITGRRGIRSWSPAAPMTAARQLVSVLLMIICFPPCALRRFF